MVFTSHAKTAAQFRVEVVAWLVKQAEYEKRSLASTKTDERLRNARVRVLEREADFFRDIVFTDE